MPPTFPSSLDLENIWTGVGTQQISIYGLCFRCLNQSSSDSYCIRFNVPFCYLCKPLKTLKKTQLKLLVGMVLCRPFCPTKSPFALSNNFQKQIYSRSANETVFSPGSPHREHGAISMPACDLTKQTHQFCSLCVQPTKGPPALAPSRLTVCLQTPHPPGERLAGKQKLVHLG